MSYTPVETQARSPKTRPSWVRAKRRRASSCSRLPTASKRSGGTARNSPTKSRTWRRGDRGAESAASDPSRTRSSQPSRRVRGAPRAREAPSGADHRRSPPGGARGLPRLPGGARPAAWQRCAGWSSLLGSALGVMDEAGATASRRGGARRAADEPADREAAGVPAPPSRPSPSELRPAAGACRSNVSPVPPEEEAQGWQPVRKVAQGGGADFDWGD